MNREQNFIIWARGMLAREFVWGETDCASLTLAGLDVFRGTDHAFKYRGLWTDEATALAHFQAELPSQVLQAIGCQEAALSLAVLGDVVTMPFGQWPECVHLVLGSRSLSADPEHGVILLPTRSLTSSPEARLWRAT